MYVKATTSHRRRELGVISQQKYELSAQLYKDWDPGHVQPDSNARIPPALARPASQVNSDPELIDHVHYDIEAHLGEQGGTSERHVYRALLEKILRTNSNLQIYIQHR